MSFLSNIFSPATVQPAQINYTPQGFNTPGLTASYNGSGYNVGRSPAMSAQIGGLQQTFGNQANALGQLASTVQPGFSQFRRAGLNQINTQQQAATSNLRDTLAQRRILGSSFANASLSQNDAEFAQERANFTAQSYLAELQASSQLIQQQYTAAAQSFSVGINQSNIETGIAAQLTAGINNAMANVAQAQAKLDQSAAEFNANAQNQSALGFGKLVGGLLTAPLTGGTSLFGMGVNALSNTFSSPYANSVDAGTASGIGTGGYNFIDAASGTP